MPSQNIRAVAVIQLCCMTYLSLVTQRNNLIGDLARHSAAGILNIIPPTQCYSP